MIVSIVLDFNMKITRPKFKDLNTHLFVNLMEIVKKCLEGTKTNIEKIDKVVLEQGGYSFWILFGLHFLVVCNTVVLL